MVTFVQMCLTVGKETMISWDTPVPHPAFQVPLAMLEDEDLCFTFLASCELGELLLQSMNLFCQTADDHVDLINTERAIRLIR